MRLHTKSLIILQAGALMALATATGCSDDTFDTPRGGDAGRIAFGVEVAGGWRDATRSGADALPGLPEVVSLQGSVKPMYLVPLVTDGIDAGAKRARATRSEAVTTSSIEDFGVFAAHNGEAVRTPDYMYNERVTRANDWAPQGDYRWPSDASLHINAYSPYAEEGSTSGEGILSLPAITDTGDLKLEYKVPSTMEAQIDLLASVPVDASTSPCDLTFNHALTGVRFVAGAQLSPCTVKSITVNGLLDSGTLDLETGVWSNVTGSATYTVAPSLALEAAEGSDYVAAGTSLLSDADGGGEMLILMPQALGTDTEVALTVEIDGEETTFRASLDGQVWEPGKTVTYRLSATADRDQLILTVSGDMETPYCGGVLPVTVNSHLSYEGTDTPIAWKAEFVDEKGDVVSRPEWVVSFPMQGNGDAQYRTERQLNSVRFDAMSEGTRILQKAADINASSGQSPYNLANATGAATVENTANCYLVGAPGKYSLPLVYGNGVKGGAANTAAYTTTSHTRNLLKTLLNHLGEPITSPYIYENAGCTPDSAALMWEDQIGLVRNVALSADGRSVTFDVLQNTIRQGNACVGVYDKEGRVMWSWTIWVTDYRLGDDLQTVGSGANGDTFLPCGLGYITAGDVTTFLPATAYVRITQTDVPDGMTPLTKTVKLTQTGTTLTTVDAYSFYQWGRKDPMMSNLNQWYTADHLLLTAPTGAPYTAEMADDAVTLREWITHPEVMYTTGGNGSGGGHTLQHSNFWNMNGSTTNKIQKTIYDPSPVGYRVPYGFAFRLLTNGVLNAAQPDRARTVTVSAADGTSLTVPLLGYRSGSTGAMQAHDLEGTYWGARIATNRQGSMAFNVKINNDGTTLKVEEPTDEYISYGFAVIPVSE